MLAFPGLDVAFIIIAFVNTAYILGATGVFFAVGQDIYRPVATCRPPISVAAWFVGFACMCFGEGKTTASFACVVLAQLHLAAWLFHELMILEIVQRLGAERQEASTRRMRRLLVGAV